MAASISTGGQHGSHHRPAVAVRVLHRSEAAGFDLVGIALAAVVTVALLARVWSETGPAPLLGPLAVVAWLVLDLAHRRAQQQPPR